LRHHPLERLGDRRWIGAPPSAIMLPMTMPRLWWRTVALSESGSAVPVPRPVLDFHRALPGYAPTPLVELPRVAAALGVGRVLVKDESDRFGLPAFKMLGASWAAAGAIRRRTGTAGLTPDAEVRLVTATAGNHGRAVARAARLLGATARVFTPASTPAHLKEAIEAEGAELVPVAAGYDDAVHQAADAARADDRAVLVQDTAVDGGGHGVLADIVAGYGTLLHEIHTELGREPDVLVVPVGVGSLAQAAATYGGAALLTVEPVGAACLLTSLRAGEPRTVPTGTTVLAGLNAGTVSAAAWPVLRDRVAAAVAVTDTAALRGTADLRRAGVAAGPCGGAALAGLIEALAVPGVRAAIGADEHACVVVLGTDGTGGDQTA
jgi:diaminopropionate ammonia-lyase